MNKLPFFISAIMCGVIAAGLNESHPQEDLIFTAFFITGLVLVTVGFAIKGKDDAV